MHFTYCPHCGSRLIQKEIGDEGLLPFCEACSVPLWDMFTTSIIAAVVNEQNEIALLRQGYVSASSYVCVAGVMKMGESAEDTVVREVKEELGLKTVLGVSNISFGLPARGLVNQNFLTMAMSAGLDLPILNPNVESMMAAVRCYHLLTNVDENAREFIAAYGSAQVSTSITTTGTPMRSAR